MVDYSVKRFNKYTEGELLEMLQDYARDADLLFVPSRKFAEATGVSEATVQRHFGSWSEFCRRASLSPRYDRTADASELFRNLDRVWQALGRQPRAKEMKQPLSSVSISRYQKVFAKPWYDICLEFLSWKSGASVIEIAREARKSLPSEPGDSHKTKREVSLSLRYEVLKRDSFRCLRCGRSPATNVGIQLHIDHKLSWANGGETILENLQTLCSECNLGKSNKNDG